MGSTYCYGVAVQTAWRGARARQRVTAVRRDRAATRIQARWRGHHQLGLYRVAILCALLVPQTSPPLLSRPRTRPDARLPASVGMAGSRKAGDYPQKDTKISRVTAGTSGRRPSRSGCACTSSAPRTGATQAQGVAPPSAPQRRPADWRPRQSSRGKLADGRRAGRCGSLAKETLCAQRCRPSLRTIVGQQGQLGRTLAHSLDTVRDCVGTAARGCKQSTRRLQS